jgi:hypothetical protein
MAFDRADLFPHQGSPGSCEGSAARNSTEIGARLSAKARAAGRAELVKRAKASRRPDADDWGDQAIRYHVIAWYRNGPERARIQDRLRLYSAVQCNNRRLYGFRLCERRPFLRSIQ